MMKLKPVIVFRIALFGFFVLIVASVASAFTAANSIAPSDIGFQSVSVNANDLKPAACADLNVIKVVHGSGTITGTSGNDLILCRSGDDIIDGNDGTDICIGGKGNVTSLNCETTLP